MHRILLFCFCAAAAVEANNLRFRIVGGANDNIENRPFQVSFEMLDGKHEHYCGGSIISKKFIVTAAHCQILPTDTRVRINTSKVGRGGKLHLIKAVTVHPNYNQPTDHDNDIAIVELVDPIKFSAGVQPIALPKKSEKLPVGTMTSVSGWGHLWHEGDSPVELQTVYVPIVDHKKCVEALAEASQKVTESMICAGFMKDNVFKDSCQNDSGGPLVARGKLYGVVSWGIECARPRFPGVYANVAHLRDFITKVTKL